MKTEAEILAKKMYLQGHPIDKISQVTGLNKTWLELKLGNKNL